MIIILGIIFLYQLPPGCKYRILTNILMLALFVSQLFGTKFLYLAFGGGMPEILEILPHWSRVQKY
jgi:H+/Cl- antiporter ClcA